MTRTLVATTLAGQSLLENPHLLWATAALVGALLVGAAVIAVADRWRKREDRPDDAPVSLLASVRRAYADGEMTHEEYQRVLAKLAPKLRGDGPPPVKPADPPPAENPDGPANPS